MAGKPSVNLADFLVYLGAELQLSRNTVAAYRRDLSRFLSGSTRLPDRAGILDHLVQLRRDHAPASVIRAMAAIRGFYRFLHAEGEIQHDPSEGLLGTRIEQRLPVVLGRRTVESLLEAFAGNDLLARRNRALMQILYATFPPSSSEDIKVTQHCQNRPSAGTPICIEESTSAGIYGPVLACVLLHLR